MARMKLHDESGRLVCVIDTENVVIEVKRSGEKEPRRVSLKPLLRQLFDAAQASESAPRKAA